MDLRAFFGPRIFIFIAFSTYWLGPTPIYRLCGSHYYSVLIGRFRYLIESLSTETTMPLSNSLTNYATTSMTRLDIISGLGCLLHFDP
jgi:hypothetical protein